MMARVDPSMQVVLSHQVIAFHSWILGDIVDSVPGVGSRQIIAICRWSTWHVSGKCWPYLGNGHWTCNRMNLNDASGGDIEPQRYWFETKLTQAIVTHSQPHHTRPNVRGRFLLLSALSPQWGLILCHCELCLHSSLPAADNEGRSS